MADKNPIMEGGPTFLVKYSNKGMDEDIPKRIPYIGPHAITVGEFMTIYNIYKKYQGKEKPFK